MFIAKIRMKNKFCAPGHWDELKELVSSNMDALVEASEKFSKACIKSYPEGYKVVVEVRVYAIRADATGDIVSVVNMSPERVFMFSRDGVDPYVYYDTYGEVRK